MTNWPHSPVHRLEGMGAYIVTAGTHGKVRHFGCPERLTLLRDALFHLAEEYGWLLQAWAVMANHYHFVAVPRLDPGNLSRMINRLHAGTALEVNLLDATPGRKVWFQYWETHLTYQRSYHARLNYVHQNPVHHHLVVVARLTSGAQRDGSSKPPTGPSTKRLLVSRRTRFGSRTTLSYRGRAGKRR